MVGPMHIEENEKSSKKSLSMKRDVEGVRNTFKEIISLLFGVRHLQLQLLLAQPLEIAINCAPLSNTMINAALLTKGNKHKKKQNKFLRDLRDG